MEHVPLKFGVELRRILHHFGHFELDPINQYHRDIKEDQDLVDSAPTTYEIVDQLNKYTSTLRNLINYWPPLSQVEHQTLGSCVDNMVTLANVLREIVIEQSTPRPALNIQGNLNLLTKSVQLFLLSLRELASVRVTPFDRPAGEERVFAAWKRFLSSFSSKALRIDVVSFLERYILIARQLLSASRGQVSHSKALVRKNANTYLASFKMMSFLNALAG